MATTLERTEISLARKNLLICVLDDDPDQVEITTSRLDKAGFPVVGTTNPQDALHKIRVGGCRAVLADFKMPAMDGLTFLQKTLQYDPGIYVILMSGFYDVQTAIEAIKGGAYDFLRKRSMIWPPCSRSGRRSANSRSNYSETRSSRASWGKARRCWRCSTWRGKWRAILPTS